jgi:hypothetical protein
MDPLNTAKYRGYDVLHFRLGYRFRGIDAWINLMNATDNYYSTHSSKTSSSQSYQLAEPRSFQFGISYDLSELFNKKTIL